MEQAIRIAVSIFLSYLVGSIPTAYIFGRALKGIDIREHGSGNMGATNAMRVLGRGPGIVVLLLDIIKGAVATTVVANISGISDSWMPVVLGLVAVAGHNWTVFLNFKGGKGIATSLGVLIGLTIEIAVIRPVLLITVFAWGISFLLSGYVSLASIIAAIILPFSMVFTRQPIEIISLGIIFCIFVVWRHRPNIKRLLTSQESKVIFPWNKKDL